MTERTLIAVVSDLIRSGLTVEQQILVNELALVVADAQRASDDQEARREEWRDRQRRHRTSRDKRKAPTPPKENNILNKKITPPTPLAEPLFDEFWSVYPLKVGKGAARKAFRHACVRVSAEEIIAGAKRYAADKTRDPKFTKHPSTWLNADCWLDEGAKVLPMVRPAPRTWAEIQAEKKKEQTP